MLLPLEYRPSFAGPSKPSRGLTVVDVDMIGNRSKYFEIQGENNAGEAFDGGKFALQWKPVVTYKCTCYQKSINAISSPRGN